MGNCLRQHSSKTWASDDWESTEPHRVVVNEFKAEETDQNKKKVVSSSTTTEVKIKLTKRQLEELLGTVDMQGKSIEEFFTQLITAGSELADNDDHLRQRSWKPALQSIPEVDCN